MTTSCKECRKIPAKFSLGEQAYCADDYRKFAHADNVLRVAQEIVADLSHGSYEISQPATPDRDMRFLLRGPGVMIRDASLDVLISLTEQWMGQDAAAGEPIF